MLGASLRLASNIAGETRLSLIWESPARKKRGSEAGGALLDSSGQVQVADNRRRWQRPGWGKLPRQRLFSKKARKLCKESSAYLESVHGLNVFLVTATLPASTSEAYLAMAAESAYLHARVRQHVRDVVPGSSCLFVWEWQKRGALHLHLAIAHRNKRAMGKFCREFKSFWIKLLERVSLRSGVDLFCRYDGYDWRERPEKIQVDAQKVKKSLRCYLSKYLSKGSQAATWLRRYTPSAWYGITDDVRAGVAAARKVHDTLVLPPLVAVNCLEWLGGQITAGVEKMFSYRNRYQPGNQYFVGLSNDSSYEALYKRCVAALNDQIRAMIRTPPAERFIYAHNACEGVLRVLFGDRKLDFDEIAQVFGGAVLADTG